MYPLLISPSDLPWWGWLLCGIVGIAVALFSAISADTEDYFGAWTWLLCCLIALVTGLGGLLAFAVGLIRFVKWVWG